MGLRYALADRKDCLGDRMPWYEVAVWGALGALIVGGLENTVIVFKEFVKGMRLSAEERRESLPSNLSRIIFTESFIHAIRVYIGIFICVGINAASPHLTIPAAIAIGAAGPALVMEIVRVLAGSSTKEKRREVEISNEAELLGEARKISVTGGPAPNGVSDDVVKILDARREELAGDLPVVRPSSEEGAAS
jgi:hypothetical protein